MPATEAHAMNATLEKAIAEISKRSEAEQEAVGAMLLHDLEERDALRKLLLERRARVKAGNVVDGETAMREMHFRLFGKYPDTAA